jgi:hypothetical protein
MTKAVSEGRTTDIFLGHPRCGSPSYFSLLLLPLIGFDKHVNLDYMAAYLRLFTSTKDKRNLHNGHPRPLPSLSVLLEQSSNSSAASIESQLFIDTLSEVLLYSNPSNILYAQGVQRLRRLCRNTQLVPTSCVIPKAVTSISDKPFSQSHFSDIWKGKLDRRDVAIKALRLHVDEAQEVKKVGYDLSSSINVLTRQRHTFMS